MQSSTLPSVVFQKSLTCPLRGTIVTANGFLDYNKNYVLYTLSYIIVFIQGQESIWLPLPTNQ